MWARLWHSCDISALGGFQGRVAAKGQQGYGIVDNLHRGALLLSEGQPLDWSMGQQGYGVAGIINPDPLVINSGRLAAIWQIW